MSISKIKRLQDFGIFRDFTWPTDLPEFGQYNLIYGWNGSGKTTIGRLFRCLELRVAPATGQATITVAGQELSNGDFTGVTLPIRVFNRDFVYETVFPTDGDVAPIFVLGKENIEKQKQVVQLKDSLSKHKDKEIAHRKCKNIAGSTLDRFCVDKAKEVKDRLRSAGSNTYNNYNKGDFRQRSEAMISAGDRDVHGLDEGTRDAFLKQIYASPKAKVEPLTYRVPNPASFRGEVDGLLATTVVSSAIQSLKKDAALSAWVHTGLGLHQDRAGKKCLFCEQLLPSDRLPALEAHFNTEFEKFLNKLAAQIFVIRDAVSAASSFSAPNASELFEDYASEYQAAVSNCRAISDSAKRGLESLIAALEDKKTRAFEPVEFKDALPEIDTNAVQKVNDAIRQHNLACDQFQARIDSTRKRLEADSVAANLDEYAKLQQSIAAAEKDVNDTAKEVERLSREIETLEREIVEHRQPAEELNRDLQNYLGHSDLRLEVKDTGYTIMRHNTPAESLSEGETTAIALLYFLKSLQDRRFDLTKGIVVLDDPVSSLDANALYSAFGFIRERTQNAAQLVMLTHNFAFFRQVRNWFHHLKRQNKKDVTQRPARFFMLDCIKCQDSRYSSIRMLDQLLEQFDSEYHYLFALVHRAQNSTPPPPLEQNYVLPNLARRLLEAFLAFRQPQVSGELWKKLQSLTFDEAKKIRILRYLHTFSHSDVFGEPEHDLSLLTEAQAILKDLLDLMRSQDEGHYLAMESLLAGMVEES